MFSRVTMSLNWCNHNPTEVEELYHFLLDSFGNLEESPFVQTNGTTEEELRLMKIEDDVSLEWNNLVSRMRTSVKKGAKRSSNATLRDNRRKKNKRLEMDYFYDYIQLYYPWSAVDGNNQARPLLEKESEDVCFGCKDGGKLIECDVPDCKKVFHTYCVRNGKRPNNNDENTPWMCPRHYCNGCGCTDNIKFMCVLCPFSSCINCPPYLYKTYGWQHYIVLPQNTLHPNDLKIANEENIIWIACHLCTVQLQARQRKRYEEPERYMKQYACLHKLDTFKYCQFCS